MIQRPWNEITTRLHRPAPHLSFIDLNSHNWQFINPQLDQPFVVENLRLAIPMVGNEDERRFQTAPIEMMYLFAPLIEPILRAQEAAVADDPHTLAESLVQISDGLKHLTYVSLMKVNPNPYHELYINPVVWGKTAALFASPFQPATESIPGPSGTAIPSFTSLDIFFGRQSYATTVGHETQRTRDWFPVHWRDWLTALEQISITDYVAQKGDKTLKGVYDEAREAYAGETGLLQRHRLKAYGFLDLSFKAGRAKTLGGIAGSYSERVWDKLATELDESRMERYGRTPSTPHMVPLKRVESIRDHELDFVRKVVFDIAGTGIRYVAGDRCAILPENSPELIQKTLRALGATGAERVQLNRPWRDHLHLRHGYDGQTELPLATLLQFGRLRPVERTAALALHKLTNNERLLAILDGWAEDQWEMWDLLAMLATAGYNPKRLWQATPGDYEHICRIIPPERWRLYSISSIQDEAQELHLTVGHFHYETAASELSPPAQRRGTGSSFLARLADGAPGKLVSVKVVHPPRFGLPADGTRPLVMFAGGTGIAPMRGLIAERVRAGGTGAMWLLFGTRQPADFYYQAELEPLVAGGQLRVSVAFSRADAAVQFDHHTQQFAVVAGQRGYVDGAMREEGNAQRLWELLQQGASFYICGRTAFANTILAGLREIIGRYEPDETAANHLLYQMMGEDRLMLEVFTSYAGTHFAAEKAHIPLSELVLHNNDEDGYWIVVSGRVYDMNAFNHMHPGGPKIIQSYAGMDGTIAYQKIEHHLNSEVDSMLGMYELGILHTPHFGQQWGVALAPERGLQVITLREVYVAWRDLLYMVVEIENALQNDFRILQEPFTDIETHSAVVFSAAKAQQIGQAHERLVTSYLDFLLGEPLPTLWRVVIGVLGYKQLDVGWMATELVAIQSSPQAEVVRGLPRWLRGELKAAEGEVAHLRPFCDRLVAEDGRFLRELKLAVAGGGAGV